MPTKVMITGNNCLWWSCFLSDCNKRKHIFVEFFPNIIPAKFSFNWLSDFREEDLFVI